MVEDAPAAEVRRPPYGRNPSLAAVGVRARTEIVDAARELFARHGYQATTVESIGEATGRSGAAVYQYFENKAGIFAIFLREAGIGLAAAGQSFPVLTHDDAGRDALQAWLGELIDVFSENPGTFLLWAQVQFSEPSLAAVGQRNLTAFQNTVLERLVAAGAVSPLPATAPLGILSVVQWSYFLFVARFPQLGRPRLERALADILLAYLFAPPGTARPSTVINPSDLPRIPVPQIPLGDQMGLRRPVTARGAGTVQRILVAAADRFSESGYHGTSLTDIAAAAGVSHGSVYTYWTDREALFGTLARETLAAVELRVAALPAAFSSAEGLAGWLDDWVTMLGQHGAVLYVWTHEVDSPALADLTFRMNASLDDAAAFIASSAGTRPDDPSATHVVLRAVLTDVPYVLSAQLGILEREHASAFVADLLRASVGAPARSPASD